MKPRRSYESGRAQWGTALFEISVARRDRWRRLPHDDLAVTPLMDRAVAVVCAGWQASFNGLFGEVHRGQLPASRLNRDSRRRGVHRGPVVDAIQTMSGARQLNVTDT